MGKKTKDIDGSNLNERQEKNRPYIRAIKAIMKRKHCEEVCFNPADYDYPDDDIPHLKLGRRKPARVMSVWIPSAQDDGVGVMAISDDIRKVVITAVDDEDFEHLFFGVYDELFDMREDRLDAEEWLDHCNVEFIRNGAAVTVDALNRENGKFLSEVEPDSPWLGVLWHVDDDRLAERHAEPGEKVRVVDESGNVTTALAEEIIPYRQSPSLPEFWWTEEKGLVAGGATPEQRALAEHLVSMVKSAIAARYVPYQIGLAGKKACVEYHPAGDPDGKSVASYRHWQEPETGMKGEDAYYDGDHVPREYCKGTLDDWFGKEPGENTSPEHVLYYLLKRFGVCVDVLDSACIYSGGPYEGCEEDETDETDCSMEEDTLFPYDVRKMHLAGWKVLEDAQVPSSFLNQSVRHLSALTTCGYTEGLHVFTRTDLDDACDNKGVCQVFLSLVDFAAGIPDAEFPDTKENLDKLIRILDWSFESVFNETLPFEEQKRLFFLKAHEALANGFGHSDNDDDEADNGEAALLVFRFIDDSFPSGDFRHDDNEDRIVLQMHPGALGKGPDGMKTTRVDGDLDKEAGLYHFRFHTVAGGMFRKDVTLDAKDSGNDDAPGVGRLLRQVLDACRKAEYYPRAISLVDDGTIEGTMPFD